MISKAQRTSVFLLGLVMCGLAAGKLLDVHGYTSALASFPLVDEERAFEVGTLFAAVEVCAGALLLLVAVFGRHAIVAFQGGAALALCASLGYAILVLVAWYTGAPLDDTALFGTFLAQAPRSPLAVVEVFVLLSWSAVLLTSAFLMPTDPPPRRPKRRLVRRPA